VAALTAANAPTVLWARDPELASAIRQGHTNPRYLWDIPLPGDLGATSEIADAVSDASLVIMAVPSHGFRSVAGELAEALPPGTPVVSLTKGLERDSQLRMTEVLTQVLPASPVGVLTGPNLASEVAIGQPTAAVVGLADHQTAQRVQRVMMSRTFRVYTSPDVVGCEIAGALKNVLAVAAGVCDGLGFGDNTRAAMITRGLAEMGRLGVALGGDRTTVAGLAGVGDLVATCTSPRSRNRTVGVALGQGRTLDEILSEMTMVAEGVKTARPMVELAASYHVEVPIASQVADLLEGIRGPGEAIATLMDRPATSEFPQS
jgi:glycerol-3-phosphate dehydrogenase (NAD(P)+)